MQLLAPLNVTTLNLSNKGLTGQDLVGLQEPCFKRLVKLDLRGNRLSDLPVWLGGPGFPALKELLVGENEVCQGSSELSIRARQGSEPLLRYLRMLHSGDMVAATTIQLVTVGNAEVGKSTLLEVLWSQKAFDGVAINEDLKRTTHVTMFEHVDGKTRWRMKDLPGQAEFYASNMIFIGAHRAVFVVVCKVTDAFDEREAQLQRWLSLLNMLNPRGRVVIVATHADRLEQKSDKHSAVSWLKQLGARFRREFPNLAEKLSVYEEPFTKQRGAGDLRRYIQAEGKKVLQNQTVSRTVLHAQDWLVGWRREHPSLWHLPPDELRSRLQGELPMLSESMLYDQVLNELVYQGDLMRFGPEHDVVVSPTWLARACAVVVRVPGEPFGGMRADKDGKVTHQQIKAALEREPWHPESMPATLASSPRVQQPVCKFCALAFGLGRWHYNCSSCHVDVCWTCSAKQKPVTCPDCRALQGLVGTDANSVKYALAFLEEMKVLLCISKPEGEREEGVSSPQGEGEVRYLIPSKLTQKTLACAHLPGDSELGWLQFRLTYQPVNENQGFPPGLFHAICCSFARVFREGNYGVGSFAQQQYFLRSLNDGVVFLDNTEQRVIVLTMQGLPAFMLLVKRCLDAARRVINDWNLMDSVKEVSDVVEAKSGTHEDRLVEVCKLASVTTACLDKPAHWLLRNCPMLALESDNFELKDKDMVFRLQNGEVCVDLQQLLLDPSNELKDLSQNHRNELKTLITANLQTGNHKEHLAVHKSLESKQEARHNEQMQVSLDTNQAVQEMTMDHGVKLDFIARKALENSPH